MMIMPSSKTPPLALVIGAQHEIGVGIDHLPVATPELALQL